MLVIRGKKSSMYYSEVPNKQADWHFLENLLTSRPDYYPVGLIDWTSMLEFFWKSITDFGMNQKGGEVYSQVPIKGVYSIVNLRLFSHPTCIFSTLLD